MIKLILEAFLGFIGLFWYYICIHIENAHFPERKQNTLKTWQFSNKKATQILSSFIFYARNFLRKVEKVAKLHQSRKVAKVDYSSESAESIAKVEVGAESRFLMSSML
jgi:hypothetical protein